MWIVIETYGGPEYAIVCTNEDGYNLLFSTEEEAKYYADNECQDGRILEI